MALELDDTFDSHLSPLATLERGEGGCASCCPDHHPTIAVTFDVEMVRELGGSKVQTFISEIVYVNLPGWKATKKHNRRK